MSKLTNLLSGQDKIIPNKIHNFTTIYSNLLKVSGPSFVLSSNNSDAVYKETIKYINGGLPNVWGMYTIKEPETVVYNYRTHVNSLFRDDLISGKIFTEIPADKILMNFPSFLIHLLLFETKSIRDAFIEDEATIFDDDDEIKFRSNFRNFIDIAYQMSTDILKSNAFQLDIVPFDFYKKFTAFQMINIMNYARGLGNDNNISFLLQS